jgi:MFS family permease
VAVCVAAGAGECFYTATLMPLTAELAPEGLRGRYMAALGFSWWAGLTIAPALGGPLLQPLEPGRQVRRRPGRRPPAHQRGGESSGNPASAATCSASMAINGARTGPARAAEAADLRSANDH